MAQSDSGFSSAKLTSRCTNASVEPLVLRMQAGVVEQLEHQMIRNENVCDQVLNSLNTGNPREAPKQSGFYSAQVVRLSISFVALRIGQPAPSTRRVRGWGGYVAQ
jgi:hypothetical protein